MSTADAKQPPDRPSPESDPSRYSSSGVWLTYYLDNSSLQVWQSEIEALRYAVLNRQECRWVQWGEELTS
jgi:hypothetical protein